MVLCLLISYLLKIIDFSLSSECTLLICCFFNSCVILYFFKCCVVPVSHDFSITWWLLQEPFCCFVFTFTMMNSYCWFFRQYANDAVLLCAASTAAELKEYLDTGFTQICTWYCDNKLTLNVKKTKLMLTGS